MNQVKTFLGEPTINPDLDKNDVDY